MDKSKRKFILLCIGLLLGITSILFQFKLDKYSISNIIVAGIPFLIAVLSFGEEYIDSSIEKRKKKKFVEDTFNEIKNYLQQSFRFTLHNPPITEENLSKDEIYEKFIKSNFKEIDNVVIQSILLCFYCDMWNKSKSPNFYEKMQKYSASIGLSLAKLTDDSKVFLNIYSSFHAKNSKYNSILDIIHSEKHESEYTHILNEFANKYIRDLSFFEIKDKLNQSENLRYTLVRIIKDGELSNWGISSKTLIQLEKDIKKKINYSKTFLVIGNKLSESVKTYLKSQPGFIGWAPNTRNTPYHAKFSAFIVKPKDKYDSAKKFLDKLKGLSKEKEEKIIFVIPLNFLNYENYVFPYNQSFNSKNLRECYEAINWFRTGREFSDTDLWNAISKSNITPNELLAVIPFNIFCEGILPCEQDFMIRNYSYIKEKCGISKLADWNTVDPNVIVDYLLEKGYPDYNTTEIKRVLGVNFEEEFDECVRIRISALCQQIVQNSTKFNDSLSLMID